MQFINYFFSSMISFLGLLIGIMLIKIAPEEQNQLRKYFVLAGKVLLVMLVLFTTPYYFNNLRYIAILIAVFISLIFIEYKISNMLLRSAVTYILLGIIFYLSSANMNLFTIASSLILVHGVATSSLFYNKKEKNGYKLIFYNCGFIIIANLLFFM